MAAASEALYKFDRLKSKKDSNRKGLTRKYPRLPQHRICARNYAWMSSILNRHADSNVIK